nr:unnamed protein product [Callosobruchus analis]
MLFLTSAKQCNLQKTFYDLSELVALGCDGTPTNTSPEGGIIHLIESTLGRSLHRFVYQLHGNELPLRHLFQYLDGKTAGPKCFSGPIGILLQKCETLPLVNYKPIETKADFPVLDCKDLSTEQKYLLEICHAVVKSPPELLSRSPGKLHHARWLSLVNRILRLYVGTENPSHTRKLATEKSQQNVRTCKLPTTKFEADEYTDLIYWQCEAVTEPPALRNLPDAVLEESTSAKKNLEIPSFPCHTQTVEGSIKLVTEASSSVSGLNRRDGFIKAF